MPNISSLCARLTSWDEPDVDTLLIPRLLDHIRSVLRSRFHRPSILEIEDLVHETFLKLRRVPLPIPSGAYTLVSKTATNVFLDHCRKEQRQQRWRRPISENENSLLNFSSGFFGEINPTPEDIHARGEHASIIWKAVNQLPPKRRDTFILYYREDFTTAEIARIESTSEDTIRKRLEDARNLLRSRLVQLT